MTLWGVTRYLTFAMLSEVTVGVTSKRLVTGLVTLFRGYSLATPWILVLLNSLLFNNLIYILYIMNAHREISKNPERRCFVIFEVTGDALGCHPLP